MQHRARAHQGGLAIASESLDHRLVARAQRLRQQDRQRPIDQLARLVAEQAARRLVDERQPAARVDHDDGVGQHIQQITDDGLLALHCRSRGWPSCARSCRKPRCWQ